MQLLDFSAPTPEENLALDEALIEHAEEMGESSPEMLRLWEMPVPCVILGRSSHVGLEVNREATEKEKIAVLRRSSGGATVVAGPGCLMYSVLLSYTNRPHLRSIDQAHREVMQKLQQALHPILPSIRWEGSCDLTFHGKKFSGNALRCKRLFLLYHGTILYDFPIDTIGKYLLEPPRQPDYRLKRGHDDFVTCIPITAAVLRQRLIEVWDANHPAEPPPRQLVEKLLQQRYHNPEWHRVE